MSETKYCIEDRSPINIFDVSDVIHHGEERLERIMWTMGSPRPTGVYSVEWCGVYRAVQEYLGI